MGQCMQPFYLIIIFILAVLVYVGPENAKEMVCTKLNMQKKSDDKPLVVQPPLVPTIPLVAQPPIVQDTTPSVKTEAFNNDLYRPDVEINSEDYESALKNMVLEPEIIAQHQKFNKELMHRVGGTSSRSPVRDDNVDIVPWVGLRRPQYQKINPNDGTARTVPSVKDADDLADYQQIMWKSASKM